MAPDIIERLNESVSIASALSIAPLRPFTHARSESINADCLNSNFLQLGRRSGGRPQRTVYPRWLHVNSVMDTTLVGLEPTTFRMLVRRATSNNNQRSVLNQETSTIIAVCSRVHVIQA